MRFDVYCDESRPDLLTSENAQDTYMVIGSLWLNAEDRAESKEAIHKLRDKYHVGGEFRWQKASPSRQRFYQELVEWFFSRGLRLRFRCIAVDRRKVDLMGFHRDDQELGFYKFYYQMLHHWIESSNEYVVFCDYKSNRIMTRLETLQRCLAASNPRSRIPNVQAVRSRESVLIQLADVLTGAAAARLNDALTPGSVKSALVEALERGLGHPIQPTYRDEQKFNVFVIKLQGGR